MLAHKKMVVGFDGFIDTTVRPIRQSATQTTDTIYFDTIKEFGEFLVGKAGKSCSIELTVEQKNVGGNLSFLTQAVGTLGATMTSIGMLGKNGNIQEMFHSLPSQLYSFADPGEAMCLEFKDGKIMLAPTYELAEEAWELIQKETNQKTPELLQAADLTAMLNWSELTFSQELWEKVYQVAFSTGSKERYVFFDLCDISRKSKEEIHSVLSLIGKFSEKNTGILSLNENEALMIGERIFTNLTNFTDIALDICKNYRIDEVIIHATKKSLIATKRGVYEQATTFVENPKKTTGAGDHFNGAICFATLLALSDEERITFANDVGNFYVRNGYSPTVEELDLSFEN